MPYFQNVFDSDFYSELIITDRTGFRVKSNLPNSSQLFQTWNPAPYDLSASGNLTLNYSFDTGRTFAPLTVNVAAGAVSASAVTASEIATNLNNNATFAALFEASVQYLRNTVPTYVVIKSKRSRTEFRVYVSNTNAETKLRFNKKAGVAEIPTYFARHTIANIGNYPDSFGILQQMDLTTTRDQDILTDAGLAYKVGATNSNATVTIKNTLPFNVGDAVVVYNGTATVSTTVTTVTTNTSLTLNNNWTGATGEVNLVVVHADWQLLRGRSHNFMFRKVTLDTKRPGTVIEYPAGSKVGDLATKTIYTYAGTDPTDVEPVTMTQQPYVLTASDLVTP